MRRRLPLFPLLLTLLLPMTATALPPPPAWLGDLDALYDARLRVAGLEDRRFSPEQWWSITGSLTTPAAGFTTTDIGRSAEGRPLRHVAWGAGDVPVLMWSQMHGDESTASMALADLVHFLASEPDHPIVRRLRERTTLHLFPIVNPDGAARFRRYNAHGIDINRDARARVTPEARALHALRERVQPAFGFNLHDQGAGYRVGDSDRGTAIALLAPAYNEAREVNATRGRAIEVAVAMQAALEPYIAGHVAKWDDTFNPRAFGDLTAAAGVSTILLESGAIEGDAQKQRLRKLNFLALVAALDAIATGAHAGLPHAPYLALPENGDDWDDLLVHGATLAIPGLPHVRADVLVRFDDAMAGRGGTIEDVGDLADASARRRVDATGLYLVPFDPPGAAGASGRFGPDAPAYFHLARDAAGRDVAWTLAGDVDPADPPPVRDE